MSEYCTGWEWHLSSKQQWSTAHSSADCKQIQHTLYYSICSLMHRRDFPVLFPSPSGLLLPAPPLAATGWRACAPCSHCPLRGPPPPLQPRWSPCCRWPSAPWNTKEDIRAPSPPFDPSLFQFEPSLFQFDPSLFRFDSLDKATLEAQEGRAATWK